jgi:hypothetical protein
MNGTNNTPTRKTSAMRQTAKLPTGAMHPYTCLQCRATMACQSQPQKCVRGCAGFACVRQD